jgi:ABC-type glycerol-3-phosphate transport system substrate-binding protein
MTVKELRKALKKLKAKDKVVFDDGFQGAANVNYVDRAWITKEGYVVFHKTKSRVVLLH